MGGCHPLITGCVTGRLHATRVIVFGSGRGAPALKYFPPASSKSQLTMLLQQLRKIMSRLPSVFGNQSLKMPLQLSFAYFLDCYLEAFGSASTFAISSRWLS